MPRFHVPAPTRADEEAFEFSTPSVAVLDRQPVEVVLNEAKRRTEAVELIPVNRLTIRDDGTLDNGMAFTEDGFGRFCRVVGTPKGFIERLCLSGARTTAMDAVRHMMRNADDDVFVTAMDAVVEGAGSDEYARISNIEAAEMLLEAAREKSGGLGELRVARAAFTGTRMHLSVTADAPSELQIPGDRIRAGVEMSNGDDGSAYTDVEGFLFRLICSNGAIARMSYGDEAGGRVRGTGRKARNDLADRVEMAIGSSMTLLGKVLPSVQINLDRSASHDLYLRGVEKFGKQFAEDVSKMADVEAGKWKRDVPTAYDWWNAVTARAKAAPSFTRRRSMEAYSADVLDWADRRYRKALAKAGSDN
ncbi:MAG: hypothetical protein BWY85_00198 [Firmicutes bacterium ADurb.Bin506]|nr:MAG: hypothetical protein BWY85_00198 [Firmicutes bacterium ADurb.Bin506]